MTRSIPLKPRKGVHGKAQQPVLEPTTQAFVDALEVKGGKPLYALSYEDARKVLEDAQAINVKKLPADIEEKVFPGAPTGEVSVRIYRPVGAKGLLPVVMYFHGGSWILGSKNTHDRLVRDLVNGSDAAFVFVNYTPSPEAQFPVPSNSVTQRRSTSPRTAKSWDWTPVDSLWPATAWEATRQLWSPSSQKSERVRRFATTS